MSDKRDFVLTGLVVIVALLVVSNVWMYQKIGNDDSPQATINATGLLLDKNKSDNDRRDLVTDCGSGTLCNERYFYVIGLINNHTKSIRSNTGSIKKLEKDVRRNTRSNSVFSK